MTNSGHWGDAYRAGVAVVTLAGFLAEVGDLSGYEYRQQIIRLAGLNLKENSSGKKKASQRVSRQKKVWISKVRSQEVSMGWGQSSPISIPATGFTRKYCHPYMTSPSLNKSMAENLRTNEQTRENINL